MYYVYRLIDPRNKLPFYIGKGKDNRMFKHEQYTKNGKYPNGNKKLYERILEIKSQNLDIIYEKIFETENENLAYKIENEKHGITKNPKEMLADIALLWKDDKATFKVEDE